jgi:cobalamin biosynthesis Co2+ chelatase CbiK
VRYVPSREVRTAFFAPVVVKKVRSTSTSSMRVPSSKMNPVSETSFARRRPASVTL